MSKRLLLWLPLAVFIAFAVFAAIKLFAPADTAVRSRLIGQPLPQFSLPAALPDRSSVESARYRTGAPRVLNVFASWCVPCIAEAPQLMALKAKGVPIDAIAIRDRPEDIAIFLERYGDPYQGIGLDNASQVQLALGSSGVPETFIVDGDGVIRFQHIGAINPNDLDTILREYEAAR